MGPDSPPTQASLTVDTSPPAPGVFETDPAEFDASGQPVVFMIQGGEQPFGAITIHRAPTTSTSTAAAPDLPEGASVELRVTVHEPDTSTETGDAFFAESGTFVQDTQPPEVVSNRVGLDSASLLHVEVEARDETTAPLGASLWFSVDKGLSWNEVGLQSLSDLFVDEKTRTFVGQAGPFDGGTRGIQYFFMTQDEVFNYNYFGVGRVCDVDGNGAVGRDDIKEIRRSHGIPPSGPNDPRDANGDGLINAEDARLCRLVCTNLHCKS